MKICKVYECKRKHHARGYCSTHYENYVRPLSAEYISWAGAKQRCNYKSHNRYDNYGGKGIKMCERWSNSFEAFLEDMGQKPTPEHSIERIDIEKDYEPSNCRWATREEQAINKSNNTFVNISGETMTISQASRKYGILPATISYRIRSGKTDTELIKSPVKNKSGYCYRNHIMNNDNTYISPGGQKQCRTCRRMRRSKK